jgi:Uma2 family endonuclease
VTTATLPAPLANPVPAPISRDIPDLPIYRLSVKQYHQMIDAGIFASDERVELIDGWLVPKMSKNPPHSHATRMLRKRLEHLRIENAYVDSQEPVTLSESEPEPDAMVVRGTEEEFQDHHPVASDVPFIGEVSESSLDSDRSYKKRTDAAARIPVYWIVNLVDNQIEVYTDPTGPASDPTYRQCRIFGPNEEVPVMIDGVEVGRIPARDLLP